MKAFSPSPEPDAAILSVPARVLFGAAFVLTAGSGIAVWLWPVQACRVLHGGSVALFLPVIGFVAAAHAIPGWRLRKSRVSGGMLLAALAGLVLSGWTLYYAGAEAVQKNARIWHAHLGSALIVIIVTHAILGLRTRLSTPTAPRGAPQTNRI